MQDVFDLIKTQMTFSDYFSEHVSKKCQCMYRKVDEAEELYWKHKYNFSLIQLGPVCDAIYMPGTSKSGIVLISDAMGTELAGSRSFMTMLNNTGGHVIKPMLFQLGVRNYDSYFRIFQKLNFLFIKL